MRRVAVLVAMVGVLALFPLMATGRSLPGVNALLPDSVVGELTAWKTGVGEFRSCMAQVKAAVGVSRIDLLGRSDGTLIPTCWITYLGGADAIRGS